MSLLLDPLALALGTANANSPCTAVAVTETINTSPGLDNDQEYARQQLLDVIEKSSNAVLLMLKVSHASMHPRAAEVLEKLLMRQQDAATKLLELHKSKAEINVLNTKAGALPAGNVNQTYIANAVFTGTTSELLDKLRGKDRTVEDHEDLLLDVDE